MTKTDKATPANKASGKDFRGLTIFELLAILAVVFGSIFWALSFKADLNNKNTDTERKARVSTLKEHLRFYVVENGSFPSAEQFEDDEIRGKLFSTFLLDQGEDAMHDPQDKSQLISYAVEPEGCAPDTDNPCTKMSVSLKLSNGEDFVKFAIQPGKELEYLQQATDEGDVNTEDLLKSVQVDPNSVD